MFDSYSEKLIVQPTTNIDKKGEDKTFHLQHKGSNYILIRENDGKLHAIRSER